MIFGNLTHFGKSLLSDKAAWISIAVSLRALAYLEIRSLSVDFSDGVVALRGKVTTYYFKQVAQKSIRRIARDAIIVNLVDVRHAEPDSGISQSNHQRNDWR